MGIFLCLANDQSPLFIGNGGGLNMIKTSLLGQKVAPKILELADTQIPIKSRNQKSEK